MLIRDRWETWEYLATLHMAITEDVAGVDSEIADEVKVQAARLMLAKATGDERMAKSAVRAMTLVGFEVLDSAVLQ